MLLIEWLPIYMNNHAMRAMARNVDVDFFIIANSCHKITLCCKSLQGWIYAKIVCREKDELQPISQFLEQKVHSFTSVAIIGI